MTKTNVSLLFKEPERIKWTINKNISSRKENNLLPIINVEGKELIFVHIPKTAGTSIGVAFGMHKKIHLTTKEIIKRIGEKKFRNAFSFSFVRNPYDRVTSHFRYLHKTGRYKQIFNDMNFGEWVHNLYSIKKPYYYQFLSPYTYYTQLDFLKDFNNNISLNFVGKFENINKDFNLLCKQIGMEKELPHLNKSLTKKEDYREYYDNESKKTVHDFFLEDIKYFHYEF